MAHTNKSNKINIRKMSGFALPTVLIASIVMLAVLLGAVVSTSAVRVSLNSQYYNQMARLAGEAGLAYANACLKNSNNIPNWAVDRPLGPNTDCSGHTPAGLPLSVHSSNGLDLSFSVDYPSVYDNYKVKDLVVKGQVNLLRKSSNEPWRSYGQVSRLSRYEQIRKQIVSGYAHSCAIAFDDKAYCWGLNLEGQLGDGTIGAGTNKNKPTLVLAGDLGNNFIKSFSAGTSHTCAIGSDNKAYCWGWNSYYLLGLNNPVIDKYTGVYAPPILHQFDVSQTSPSLVDFTGTFKSIAAGDSSNCAVDSSDKAYCWGKNHVGQVGINVYSGLNSQNNIGVYKPLAVYNDNFYIKQSSDLVTPLLVGHSHVCAIATNSNTYCWGSNDYGQIGINTATTKVNLPTQLQNSPSTITSLAKVSGSVQYTCGIGADKKAYCWGDNSSGQLGIGSLATVKTFTPTVVAGSYNSNILSLAIGPYNGCFISANDYKAYCWGSNTAGQIGDGTAVGPVASPTPVNTGGVLSGKKLIDISVGYKFACVVDFEGKVYCWGLNGSGQLGDGTNTGTQLPVVTFTPPTVDYRF